MSVTFTVPGEDRAGPARCADTWENASLHIEEADRVIIWWDPDSQGSLFDIGMAWALRKPLSLMNHVDFEPGKKSFAAMLNWWADGYAQAPLFAEVTP